VLCVVSKDKKVKDNQDKEKVRMKYEQSKIKHKKNPAGGIIDVSLL
jgi:hypothetical protein